MRGRSCSAVVAQIVSIGFRSVHVGRRLSRVREEMPSRQFGEGARVERMRCYSFSRRTRRAVAGIIAPSIGGAPRLISREVPILAGVAARHFGAIGGIRNHACQPGAGVLRHRHRKFSSDIAS